MHGHLHLQTITVHPADDSRGFLIVRIVVTCDVCGENEIVLAGHHLRPLLELLQSVVDEADPALVDEGERAPVQRSTYHITDPRNN
jgi:hypothetical protein